MRQFVAGFSLALLLHGCGGGSGQAPPPPPPPPPPTASLVVAEDTRVNEADNPLVVVSLSLDRPATGTVSASATIAGTATNGYDYVVSGDQFEIAFGESSASIELDIYRDFDEEEDETITLELGGLTGEAVLGEETSVTVEIVDGGGSFNLKTYQPPEPESQISEVGVFLLPFFDTRMFVTFAVAFETLEPMSVTGEIASDPEFAQGVRIIHESNHTTEELEALRGTEQVGLIQGDIVLPLGDLKPDTHYYLRFYGGDAPFTLTDFPTAGRRHTGFGGFVTNSQGAVRTRCFVDARIADPTGADPLFTEQWHLVNTGQSSFSDSPGVSGADLRMNQAIEDGRSGRGVRVAVYDTGLEICHPDLAANVVAGESHRFPGYLPFGSDRTDPFNHTTLGDHGTSVAGVLAASANNGLGGRGVAPEVDLVGYSFTGGLFEALGGSTVDPNSASMHVFNMSFGTIALYRLEDRSGLLRRGTSELRESLGALYVKSAGNYFEQSPGDHCWVLHPLNHDLGCLSSHSDPMQGLPYVLTIGGFNASDVKASYASAGANLWVVGPSGEGGQSGPGIITTDQTGRGSGYSLFKTASRLNADHPANPDGDYTSAFGGTSSAAPAVAGVVALLLEAKPALTWRDVKHLLAASARQIDPEKRAVRFALAGHPYVAQHSWVTNAAGYRFHNWYGFGAASVDAAIALTQTHQPGSLGEFTESDWFANPMVGEEGVSIPDADGRGVSESVIVEGLPEAANIEAVILEISARHEYLREFGMTLISPSGTPNVINPPFNRLLDVVSVLEGWQILSNAFYGESPNGEWTLQVVDVDEGDVGSLTDWRLKFHYGEHGEGAVAPQPR